MGIQAKTEPKSGSSPKKTWDSWISVSWTYASFVCFVHRDSWESWGGASEVWLSFLQWYSRRFSLKTRQKKSGNTNIRSAGQKTLPLREAQNMLLQLLAPAASKCPNGPTCRLPPPSKWSTDIWRRSNAMPASKGRRQAFRLLFFALWGGRPTSQVFAAEACLKSSPKSWGQYFQP